MLTAQDLLRDVNAALKDTVVKLGSDPSLTVHYLPTGVLAFDHLLQGGLPRGRMAEVFGNFSTLKSYLGLCAIARTQQDGGLCALIDTEHSFDPEWAASIGVRTGELIVQHPATGELAIDTAEALIRAGIDLVVFDSVAATLPQAEHAKRLHDEQVQPARLAALMSVACRKLTSANSRTAVLWINQTRMNVGITFGNPETTPGGKALPFYASVRVSMRKAGAVTTDERHYDGTKYVTVKKTIGQKIRATVEKSKLNTPYREVHFTFDLTAGRVDEEEFLMNRGIEAGLVTNAGRFWTLAGVRKGSRADFKTWLASSPPERAQLEDLVRQPVLSAAAPPTNGRVKARKGVS